MSCGIHLEIHSIPWMCNLFQSSEKIKIVNYLIRDTPIKHIDNYSTQKAHCLFSQDKFQDFKVIKNKKAILTSL